jgi:ATP-dependent Clp protease protease subunit
MTAMDPRMPPAGPVVGPWPPQLPEVPNPFGPPSRPLPPIYPPVPMVYERSPEHDELADRLLGQRRILIGGYLDRAASMDAAGRLMLLDSSGEAPIELVVSCPDGELFAAMALADTIELVGVEVRAICAGSIGGAAVLPFALATRRLAQQHASFRFGDPQLEVQGRASEIAHQAEGYSELLATMHRRIAGATLQSIDTVAADFQRHRHLSAKDALSYGLVDEILRKSPLRAV